MGKRIKAAAKLVSVGLLVVWSLAATAEMKLYYVHNDHLNTPQLLTDENQNVVWAVESQTPFGEVVVNEDPDGDGERVVFNVRFPGQYFDEETGLSYNYYRTYDPSLGRYVQSDPIGLDDGPNTYAYVGNNPTNYVDPDGLSRRRPGAPSPGQAITNMNVNSLIRQIRQIDPAFRYQTVRPIGPAGRYNIRDINALQQYLRNAQSAGFCGAGASQTPNFLNNGQVSSSNFPNIVSPGTPNSWRPTQALPNGFNYQWTNNGVRFRLWGHGANPNAPSGSFSQSNATATLQVNGRTVTSTGTTVRNTRSPQNAPLVHLPLVP